MPVGIYTPVMSDEDEVSLVVEGEDSPPGELGDLREPGRKHPPHTVTESSGEVVEYHLRFVLRHLPMPLQNAPIRSLLSHMIIVSVSHDNHVITRF